MSVMNFEIPAWALQQEGETRLVITLHAGLEVENSLQREVGEREVRQNQNEKASPTK